MPASEPATPGPRATAPDPDQGRPRGQARKTPFRQQIDHELVGRVGRGDRVSRSLQYVWVNLPSQKKRVKWLHTRRR